MARRRIQTSTPDVDPLAAERRAFLVRRFAVHPAVDPWPTSGPVAQLAEAGLKASPAVLERLVDDLGFRDACEQFVSRFTHQPEGHR